MIPYLMIVWADKVLEQPLRWQRRHNQGNISKKSDNAGKVSPKLSEIWTQQLSHEAFEMISILPGDVISFQL